MPFSLVLPDGYEYVLLTGVASTFLTLWQGTLVGIQRRKAGINYPQLYAEKAEMTTNKEAMTFNNLQRAHQNTLESYSQTMLSLLIAGTRYPRFAATIGGIYIFGRILFTRGYRQGPDKRNIQGGFLAPLCNFTLILTAARTVIGLVRENGGFKL